MAAMNPLMRFVLDAASRQLNVAVSGESDDFISGTDDEFDRKNTTIGRRGSDHPTSSPTTSIAPLNTQEIVGFVVVSISLAIMLLACYWCYAWWQRRRERQFMDYVNTRADSVLGDMVMVSTNYNEEDDDDRYDSELL
jgi:hypothetical protein